MKTAFVYGADAAYLGIPDFSLRTRINDFRRGDIKAATEYAHQRGKKVYVTVNIFAHNRHLRALPAYLRFLRTLNIDALIVSDPGVLRLARRICPQTEIHLSTQANCTNLEAVKFWAGQGVKRIILGREVTLKEIKTIHRAAPRIDLEYFVHGAMCMAYSGRCFLSKLFVDRSANCGDCAQPCRWPHDLQVYRLKTADHAEELELVEERHGAYLLNSRDLCLVRHLPDLVSAGITSFKIEGRAKSVYYQAAIAGVYRRALDLIVARTPAVALKKSLAGLFRELEEKLVHRGYTEGFLLGGRAGQNINAAKQASTWEFCGQVVAPPKNAFCPTGAGTGVAPLYLRVHNTIKVGDALEIIRPEYDIIKRRPTIFWDAKTGAVLKEAHGGSEQIIVLLIPESLGNFSEFTVCRRKIGW
jgi:putative protease